MDSAVDFFSPVIVSESDPSIRICRVDIDALVRAWFGDLAPQDLRRPAENLSAQSQINDWLAADELETVNGFKALKRQVEWLAGRLAAKTLVTACLDPDRPASAVIVAREPDGAPFLPAFADHCLSISHAGRFALAALSLTPELAVGIDIEKLPPPTDESFLGMAFAPRERASGDLNDPGHVARAWCLKEAYLKYLRQGFHIPLHQVEILNGQIFHQGRPATVAHQVWALDPNHLAALVYGLRPDGF